MNVRQVLLRGGAGAGGTVLLVGAMWLHSVRPEVRAGNWTRSGPTGRSARRSRLATSACGSTGSTRRGRCSFSIGGARPVGTDGVYLVVRLSATAGHEPLQLASAELETPGGYTFKGGPRTAAASLNQPTLQPMIWTSTKLVFELPKDRVEGAHLVVGTGGLLQLSSAADIDLKLNRDRAAKLVQSATERYQVRTETS